MITFDAMLYFSVGRQYLQDLLSRSTGTVRSVGGKGGLSFVVHCLSDFFSVELRNSVGSAAPPAGRQELTRFFW